MAVFQPNVLLDPALRILATELGIPTVDPASGQNRGRPEIEQDIQQQFPNLVLLSAPIAVIAPPAPVPSPVPAQRDRLGNIAVIATALTALFTVLIAVANWMSAVASQAVVTQTAAEKEEDKRYSWQTHKVYEIISEAGKEAADFKGLSFDSIMTHYRSAAQDPEMAVKIVKDDLKPFVLQKILTELQATNLIYQTWDNNYIAQRTSINTRADSIRVQMVHKAVNEILKTMRDKSGKISENDLEREVKRKLMELKDDDYLLALYQLAAQKLIFVDNKRQVWTSLHPPAK